MRSEKFEEIIPPAGGIPHSSLLIRKGCIKMAVFGMFNFGKAGPGVSKDAPQKKAFFQFVSLYFYKFWKLMAAGLLYVLFSLTVVTVGLAEVGLCHVTRSYVRGRPVFIWDDFISAIKKNWKQALPLGFVNLALTMFLLLDCYFYRNSIILMVIAYALLITFLFMQYYIPLLIVTFKFTFKQIYKNALILAFAGLVPNLIISLSLLPYYFFWYNFVLNFTASSAPGQLFPVLLLLVLIYILFYNGFRSLVTQFCVFPVVKKFLIDPYYAKHPEADAKLRKSLNMEVEPLPEAAEAEAPIFTDMGKQEEAAPRRDGDKARIPRQYREQELRKFKSKIDRDDDGTI